MLDSLLSLNSKQSAKKSNKQHLDRAVARFFFENAIPFNFISLPNFADLMGECLSFRKHNPVEYYKVPARTKLSGPLLDDTYESVQASEALFVVCLLLLLNLDQQ